MFERPAAFVLELALIVVVYLVHFYRWLASRLLVPSIIVHDEATIRRLVDCEPPKHMAAVLPPGQVFARDLASLSALMLAVSSIQDLESIFDLPRSSCVYFRRPLKQ